MPVEVLVSDRRSGPESPGADPVGAGSESLFVLAHRNAFLLRASVANPRHFLAGLRHALASRRPALVHLHAPSPGRDGFPPAAAHAQASPALNARVFPCLRYDPEADGGFGLRLSLERHPAPGRIPTYGALRGAPPTPVGEAGDASMLERLKASGDLE